MDKLNWLRKQVMHVIGQKITAKAQVTDVRFARVGKVSLASIQSKQRQQKRAAARDAETAPLLQAGISDLVESIGCIHRACVPRSANSPQHLIVEIT